MADPSDRMDIPSPTPVKLYGWEKSTNGAGRKIMQGWGYKGEGLGSNNQGPMESPVVKWRHPHQKTGIGFAKKINIVPELKDTIKDDLKRCVDLVKRIRRVFKDVTIDSELTKEQVWLIETMDTIMTDESFVGESLYT